MQWLREGIFKERRAVRFFVCVCVLLPSLTERTRREGRHRWRRTWVDGPMFDPPQQLSPEQLVKKSLYLSFFLSGDTTSTLHRNPTSAQRTQIGSHSVFQQQLTDGGRGARL